jgi:adenylylsulfate kinase
LAQNANNIGFTLFFTGLPCSGKSTIANEIKKLVPGIIILDGDTIRIKTNNFDYSHEGRCYHLSLIRKECNILNNQGVNIIASFICPYESERDKVKNEIVNSHIIFIDSTLSLCKERDVKGMYKKALNNEIEYFTGVSDVYEPPIIYDLKINTNLFTKEYSTLLLFEYMKKMKLV